VGGGTAWGAGEALGVGFTLLFGSRSVKIF
jgi:hypothetical protein